MFKKQASNWGDTLIAVANCGYNGLNVYWDDICRQLKIPFKFRNKTFLEYATKKMIQKK